MFQESMQKAHPTQTWIKDKPLGVTSYTTLPPWLSQLVNKRKQWETPIEQVAFNTKDCWAKGH